MLTRQQSGPSLDVRMALIGALVILGLVSPASGAEDAWNKVDEESGITVYSKETGTDLMAFRGTGIVEADIASITGLFTGLDRSDEWVDLMAESKLLEEKEPLHKTYWQRYDQPWPVTDRDFVMQMTVEVDAGEKVVTVTYRSVDDPAVAKKECCVRGYIEKTEFRLEARPDGTTWVDVRSFLDPKGSLPTWMVNMVQEGWPVNTIEGIRRMMKKGDVKPYEPIADWH